MVTPPRRLKAAATLVAVGSVLAVSALALVPGTAAASPHREAPLIAADPYVDSTDVYAFRSPDKPDTVTLIANWYGLQEPNGGPTFYPWATDAHYDINIDSDGDAKPDTTYRYQFTTDNAARQTTFLYNNGPVTSLGDPNLLFKQFWTLTKIQKGKAQEIAKGQAAPSNTGAASMPDYAPLREQAISPVGQGGRTYVGPSDDPSFRDQRLFDLLYGGNLSETGQDTLAGFNVNSIALQLPISEVALNNDGARNPVIGVWSDTERQSTQLKIPDLKNLKSLLLDPRKAIPPGDFAQVSRRGQPLFNEIVLSAGLMDTFNGLTPDKDAGIAELVTRVTDPELPKLVQGIYGIPAPPTPRNDLFEIFLTGIATNAPTSDGSLPPIRADLNSQVLNQDADRAKFRPSEMLRLNTQIPPAAQPNRLGVVAGDLQGFPNGRRLTDDVVDISVQVIEGAAVTGIVPALAAGDGVNTNDEEFGGTFPYIALPNSESVNSQGGAVPPPGVPGSGPSLPGPSVLTGLAAMALLSTGVVLLARRRATATPSAA